MGYDYQLLFEKIIQSVSENGSVTDRVHAVIAECERQVPHPHWGNMRRIDFEADNSRLKNWLPSLFQDSTQSRRAKGLWFGLFTTGESGKEAAEIYVATSSSYDAKSIDWATETGQLAPANYLGSHVLRDIYSEAYRTHGGLGNTAEYPLVLSFGAIAARIVLEDSALTRKLSNLQGAAVGFDSGDFLFLGEFVQGKFVLGVRGG